MFFSYCQFCIHCVDGKCVLNVYPDETELFYGCIDFYANQKKKESVNDGR